MGGGAPPGISTLPDAYQAWRTSELGRITDRIEEDLLAALIGPVQGKMVLDVGCGDGVTAVWLARKGAEVIGLDADPRMLVAARTRSREAGAAVVFVEGDVRALPFPDRSFDVVVAVTVLCFVNEAERAVQEMARVLRPGGRLVVGELGRYSVWAVKRRLVGWLGSRTWQSAIFRSARELEQLATAAGVHVCDTRGAIFYPPFALCARWLAPLEPLLSATTTIGAAFVAIAACKPDNEPMSLA